MIGPNRPVRHLTGNVLVEAWITTECARQSTLKMGLRDVESAQVAADSNMGCFNDGAIGLTLAPCVPGYPFEIFPGTGGEKRSPTLSSPPLSKPPPYYPPVGSQSAT